MRRSLLSSSPMRRTRAIISVDLWICSNRLYTASSSQQPSVQKYDIRSNIDSHVSALISAIRQCGSISYCRAIHAQVFKFVNYRHGFLGDQLVNCYLQLGYDEDAEKLFDEMPEKDLVSWNSLISGYSGRGCLDKCLDAFSKMRFQMGLSPNGVTFISVISACTCKRFVEEGRGIHGFAVKLGVLEEVKVTNTLVNFYGKTGDVDSACGLFDEMVGKNLVTWNSMISVHTHNGLPGRAFGYFNMMRRAGIESDKATVLAVFHACEALGLGKLAESIHGFITFCGLDTNTTIATACLDLYSKLGRLKDSSRVFQEMVCPDKVAWSAMLAAYAVHGHGREAIDHFELMLKTGVKPDQVTYTHLLSACSHAGLVEEGQSYFKTMSEIHGIEPRMDHYSCMVDLMARSGLLNEAYELIKEMPIEPNSGVWGALLGACRVYGNTQLGKEAAERLIVLEPSDPRNYIMLSNIYSAAGLWKEASKFRLLMKEKGLTRNSGCSYVEHDNTIHRFSVGDWSHPESERIHKKLKEVIGKITNAGYSSRTEFVLHDVDEEMKEDMIIQHSEKLAMAFGLLVINPDVPIIITKNLRICGDCHNYAKAISLIEKRTIIIRDTKRFHHFSNGLCSCKDYW